MPGAPGSFEASGEARFIRDLAASTTDFACVDVGANLGGYARLVHDCFGARSKIWCFEPAPETYRQLVENTAGLANVRCYDVALSDANAESVLYLDHRGTQFSSLTPMAGTKPQAVRTARLDDVAEREGIHRIDLLKIDVEGHEMAVLRGASRLLASGAIARVQFEYGENNALLGTRIRDFYDLFGDRFSMFRIVRDGLWPLGDYRQSLEISTSATNYVAIARD